MGRVIGMDIHRTFAEVVFWEAGRLRPAGRVDMTKAGLEGFVRIPGSCRPRFREIVARPSGLKSPSIPI